MTRSRLLVIAFIAALAVMLFGLRWFTDERGKQGKLTEVQCEGLLPTIFELQGVPVSISREQTCDLMHSIATMQPTADEYHNDPNDPWHYYGRMIIRPKDDAWFLVFIARRSNGFKPEFSLQHRRGAGWTVIGQFEAESLLRKLNVQLDTAKLHSPESLTPTDQDQSM